MARYHRRSHSEGLAMPRTFVFDAYGTLFDVHAAIGRYRAAAGPDADRFSEFWRSKQLEYSWTSALAGRYLDFLDADGTRARFGLRALFFRRQDPQAKAARRLSGARFPDAPCAISKRVATPPRSCRTARRKCSRPPSRQPASAATSMPFSRSTRSASTNRVPRFMRS